MPDAQTRYRQVSELLFGSDRAAATTGDDEGNEELDLPEPPPPAAGSTGRQDTEPIPRLPHG
jgi:hypothetical protein